MKNKNMRYGILSLLLVVCLLFAGCGDKGDDTQKSVMPNFETNQLTKFSYTSLWYMSTVFDVENGVEFKDADMMHIVALFDDVAFEVMEYDQKKLEALYLELMDAQYILLEGGGTLMVGENGRLLLTLATGEIMVTPTGAFDAQSLRTLIATLTEGKK